MLKIGMMHEETIAVDEHLTADKLGNRGIVVFSTPSMLAFLEATCRHMVADLSLIHISEPTRRSRPSTGKNSRLRAN